MSKFFLTSIIFFLVSISNFCFSQIGNENGKYDKVIDESYKVISDIRHLRSSALRKKFQETGFQTKKEFNYFTTRKNLKWAKEIILKYGIPAKESLSISEWKISTREDNNASINITYYFKNKDAEFKPTDNHISINFKQIQGKYVLDGIMTFKEDDYLRVKEIIDNMP